MKRLKGWLSGRLCIRLLLLLLALMAMLGVTAAYFTDHIAKEAHRMKTAKLRFSYADQESASGENVKMHGIIADFTELDEKTTPYQKGELLNLQFRTRLSGDAAALVVPCFQVEPAGGNSMDVFAIYALIGEKRELLGKMTGKDGKCAFYQTATELQPEKEQQFSYQIEIEERSDAPLRLSFDFAVAGIQKSRNEAQLTERNGESLFAGITARHEGEEEQKGKGLPEAKEQETSYGSLIGFTDICTLLRAVDQTGAPVDPSARMPYVAVLLPKVQAGNPAGHSITWYELHDGKETAIQAGISTDGSLQLLLQKRSLDRSFRYEVRNEAGIQYSPRYSFRENGDSLLCEAASFVAKEAGE